MSSQVALNSFPEDLDVVGDAQVPVVELELHVDDVSYALVHYLNHLEIVPNASPDRYPVGHPGQIHR